MEKYKKSKRKDVEILLNILETWFMTIFWVYIFDWKNTFSRRGDIDCVVVLLRKTGRGVVQFLPLNSVFI